MLERQIARCGVPPRQVAADGGYASRDNLTAAKARGVRDVAFHKKRDLAVEDMVKSHWVYRKLRNFRAGIEAGISCLKRAYGLARCTWRGLDHFKTYIWPAVVAHNLVLFALPTLRSPDLQVARRARCRLSQEARPGGRRHGQEPLGLSQTAELSRRDRGRDLLPQASQTVGSLEAGDAGLDPGAEVAQLAIDP